MVKLIENQVESHKEFEMIKITDEVKKAVEESGIKNGMVAVITKHTTTGIMINEALPCVEKDIEMELERLVPHDYPYVHTHMLPTYGTCSGNAPGHLKSMLAGNHCIFPVNGRAPDPQIFYRSDGRIVFLQKPLKAQRGERYDFWT